MVDFKKGESLKGQSLGWKKPQCSQAQDMEDQDIPHRLLKDVRLCNTSQPWVALLQEVLQHLHFKIFSSATWKEAIGTAAMEGSHGMAAPHARNVLSAASLIQGPRGFRT